MSTGSAGIEVVGAHRAAEVVVMFEESVIAVRDLVPGQRFDAGGAHGVDPAWPVDDAGAHALVRMSPAGRIELCAPAGLPVTWSLDDGAQRGTPPHFVASLESGERVATLPSERRARAVLGEVTLLVSEGAAPRRQHMPARFDLRAHATTAIVGVLFGLMLLAIQAIPPVGGALEIDPFLLSQRGVRMVLVPPVEPPSSGGAAAAAPAAAAAQARAHHAPRATPSSAVARHTVARGRSDAERREAAQQAAQQSGVLGVVRGFEASQLGGAVFGTGSPFGDGDSVLASLHDGGGSDGGGSGGPGLVGGGHGGRGEGTVGVGPLRAGGGGGGAAGGNGHGLGGYKSRGPGDGPPQIVVHGPLDKELIRRAVRQLMPAFRFCYERELQHHPQLAGRVVTSFTIAPNGHVVQSSILSSTVENASVDACVAETFRRLSLPAMPPGGGSAMVRYPLAFTAAGQTATAN